MPTYPVSLCDISFQHPDYACLRSKGYQGAYRYVGPGSGKLLTQAEAWQIHNAGLALGFLVEGSATDDEQGFALGAAYASQAVLAVHQLDLPLTSDPVYVFTADHDSTGATIPLTEAYFRGVATVLHPYQVGCYGDVDIMTALRAAGLATYFILADASGWNPGEPTPPWIETLQGPNGLNVCGGNLDNLRSQSMPVGMWLPAGTNPTNGETEMRFRFNGFANSPAGFDPRRVHVTDGLRYRVLPIAANVDAQMSAAGAGPITDLTPAQLYGWDYPTAVGFMCGMLDHEGADTVPAQFDIEGTITANPAG